MTRQQLHSIAKRVRRWTQEEAIKRDVDPDTLDCMCGIASYKLFQELRKAGVANTYLCVTPDDLCGVHAFVVCGARGTVVDVTASQFDCKAIEIVDRAQAKHVDHWKIGRKFSNDRSIRKYFADWPPDQLPVFKDEK